MAGEGRDVMNLPLDELVFAYTQRRTHGAELWRALYELLARWAQRFHDGWFPQGARDKGGMDLLCNDVFERCELQPQPRHPYLGRAPFRAFTEERMPPPPIRWHVAYDRWSVARAVLTRYRRQNLRRDPMGRLRERYYRALGPVLERMAEPVPAAGRTSCAWRTRGAGLGVARDQEEVIRLLSSQEALVQAARERAPGAFEALVLEALRLSGAPQTRLSLTEILTLTLTTAQREQGRRLEDEDDEEEEKVPLELLEDSTLRHELRETLLRGWHSLDSLERAFVRAFATGADADEMLALDPRLGNPTALTRAHARVSEKLLAPLRATLGLTSNLPPQRQLDELVRALLQLFPEWT